MFITDLNVLLLTCNSRLLIYYHRLGIQDVHHHGCYFIIASYGNRIILSVNLTTELIVNIKGKPGWNIH